MKFIINIIFILDLITKRFAQDFTASQIVKKPLTNVKVIIVKVNLK